VVCVSPGMSRGHTGLESRPDTASYPTSVLLRGSAAVAEPPAGRSGWRCARCSYAARDPAAQFCAGCGNPAKHHSPPAAALASFGGGAQGSPFTGVV
jgi:hypothetical protein